MARTAKPVPLASIFAALADSTRLRLLNLMAGREVCVCYFVEILRQGQPKISRHLAYLRRAGIVAARREGKWMHYRITPPSDPAAASILCATLASLLLTETEFREAQDQYGETFTAGMGAEAIRTLLSQADLAKLDRACCAPQKLVMPEGAPRPTPVRRPA